jgi:phosphohistidine phosphatase
MGARLKMEKQFIPDLVVSSPSVRTKRTAFYVCEQLDYPEENIVYEEDVYEASVRTLLRVVNSLDDKFSNVLLFGHNPGLSYLSEYITKETIGDLPTAAIISLQFDFDSWAMVSEATGRVSWYIYPKDGE